MNTTPTPETDALHAENVRRSETFEYHFGKGIENYYSHMREHAEKMERERDEALAIIQEVYPELINYPRPAVARRILERIYNPNAKS